MEEINITLETLYDILRNEKKREDLQKLNERFFYDVTRYLKEKKSLLETKQHEDDLFAAGEREKIEYELRSIKRILKEIYEKREKKLIDIALNRSRTKSDIIDTSAMLREEKDFYEQLIKLLDAYRGGILMNLFKGEIPFFLRPDIKVSPSLTENQKETPTEEQLPPEESPLILPPLKPVNPETTPQNNIPKLKKIRFLHPVPSFVWKDLKETSQLKEYGPFEAGEEFEIFAEVADLIIEKQRAEEVK